MGEGHRVRKNSFFHNPLLSGFGLFVALPFDCLCYDCSCPELPLSQAAMDPFAAFSLACGIIQVLDFSTKVAKRCQELCRDGVSSDYKEIEEMAQHLTNLRKDLDLTEIDGENELQDLGSKCAGTAQELVTELQKMKINGPHRKRQVARKTLKTMIKGSPIDLIQKRLNYCQSQLDSRILVDLRFVHYRYILISFKRACILHSRFYFLSVKSLCLTCIVLGWHKAAEINPKITNFVFHRKRYHLTSLQNNKKFQDLDSKVQAIIMKLTQSPQSFDELKSLTQHESQSVKGHVTDKIQQNRDEQAYEQCRREVLKSLWFPEIYRRQETVGEAHRKTFEWIFEPDGLEDSARRWHSFVQWLEQGDGIYWINGKPGSGKSTLINYICQDSRVSELLRVWSGPKEVFILKFFFWNAGVLLERSSEGLLRSLLYQIFRRFSALEPSILGEEFALDSSVNNQQNYGPTAAWTERRLRPLLNKATLQTQRTCRICIFIDGLDESSDDADSLIAVIENMVSADTKICVSSRPDQSYSDAFDSASKLRLQDLTELDIKTYLYDKLQPALQENSAGEDDVSQFLTGIIDKAQGIFLWVRLVAKTLISGLRNHDSLDQLRMRVESTPSDIEAMYAKMLTNINLAHRTEAALLFRMALNQLTESLLNVTFVLCNEIRHVSVASGQSALHFSRQTRERIPTVAGGLLEVHLEDEDSVKDPWVGEKYRRQGSCVKLPFHCARSSETADLSLHERHAHVDFIHRTAIDFLRHGKKGQLFINEHTTSCFSIKYTYVRGLLAKLSSLGFPEKPDNLNPKFYEVHEFPSSLLAEDLFDRFLDTIASLCFINIVRLISEEEGMTAKAQSSLCDDVNITFMNVYQRYQVVLMLSHWDSRSHSIGDFAHPRSPVAQYSETSSRSSSPDMFYQARSEPTLSANELFDFLGLAACWGLYDYVQEQLDVQSDHLEKGYIDYLLCCSLVTLPRSFRGEWKTGAKKLMDELLSRGGNPNVVVEDPSTTIWGLFLRTVSQLSGSHCQGAYATTAKAFLEAGADVHLSFERPASLRRRDYLRAPASSNLGEKVQLDIYLEDSALSIVHTLLERAAEWTTVQEILLAKGGYESRRCTDVDVSPHWISTSQQKALISALNTPLEGDTSQCYTNAEWQSRLDNNFAKCMATFGDPDRQKSSSEDVPSDPDAEDEFFDSLDTQDVEDPKDNHLVA